MWIPSLHSPAAITQVQPPDVTAHQAVGLAAICAACPGLRSLHMLLWHHPPAALQPLAALSGLHTLEIASQMHMGADGLATLAQLPRLRRLALQCRKLDGSGGPLCARRPCTQPAACAAASGRHTRCFANCGFKVCCAAPAAGLAALTGLTSLDLSPGTLAAEADLLPALCQLTALRHLGLDSPGTAILAGLTQLTALQQLTSLILEQADCSPSAEHGLQPAQALLQLIQGLGGTSAGASGGGGSSSPGRQGLRRLRLASSQSDPDAGGSLLPLSALSGLEGLGVAYPGLQASMLLPCASCPVPCVAAQQTTLLLPC